MTEWIECTEDKNELNVWNTLDMLDILNLNCTQKKPTKYKRKIISAVFTY